MLINIQFLRMVAAMLVVFYHTSAHVRSMGAEQGAFFAINDAIGFAGVDIFFVISGFIMAHTSFSAAGWADGWSFLRRRLARIYSGYWPFFLLALALFAWVDMQFLRDARLFRSAILWPAWPQLIAVSWTLTFEMFFYLLFTVVIALTVKVRSALLWLLFALMLAFTAYSEFVRHAYAPGSLEYMGVAEYYILSPYLLEFLGGALVAYRMRSIAVANKAVWGSLMLLVGTVAFVLGGWINLQYFDGGIEQGYSVFYRVLVFGLPSLLIIAGLVRLDQAGIRAPARFSLMTGGASYAIYLSHTLILIGLQKLGFNEFAAGIGGLKMQVLYFGLTLAILGYSVLHYRMVERPLHRRFKRWLRVS
ncbi:MAG TPA: acyltransferase [Xanthomonadales bacterium]|nr:acyltransferase [Xanthomonadales bacterium]